MYRKVIDRFIAAIGAGAEPVGRGCRGSLSRGTDYSLKGLRYRLFAILLACTAMLQPNAVLADSVPVLHKEGLMHGFLVLRTLDGKAIADGQLTQDARGDRVT